VEVRRNEAVAAKTRLLNLLEEPILEKAPTHLKRDVHSALAANHYAIAWKNREEGKGSEEWRQDAEAAVVEYRFLVKSAESENDEAAVHYRHDLDRVNRLLTMSATEFAGLPFPSNSPRTANCLEKTRKSRRNLNQSGYGDPEDVSGEMHDDNSDRLKTTAAPGS